MMALLAQPFMQHALLACLLVSLVCGLIGTLIMVNRLSFMSGGMAHGAYGGVGLALYAGWPVLPVTAVFTALLAVLLGTLAARRRERIDTLIGVLWAAGMALGIILINLTPGYAQDLMSYLFGSLLTVSRHDLLLMFLADLLIIVLVSGFYRSLLVVSFDEDFARSRQLPVLALQLMLLILVAETIVMLIQVVGLILVIALLSLPPAVAELHARGLRSMMLAASLWCLLFCLAGLALAFAFNLSTGACIIACGCVTYLVLALILSRHRAHRRRAATNV